MSAKKTSVSVPTLDLQHIQLTLIGDTPLIVHNFSTKSRKEILDKQQKRAKRGREARDPESEYKEAFYVIEEGVYGFPAMGFKKAAVRAAKSLPGMTMTDARGYFHIICDPHMLIPLKYESVECVEDVIRLSNGSADLRYRPYFYGWSVDLNLRYNQAVVSDEQIVMMFDLAGFGVGVGDWRPEKNGQFGMFHVDKAGTE